MKELKTVSEYQLLNLAYCFLLEKMVHEKESYNDIKGK